MAVFSSWRPESASGEQFPPFRGTAGFDSRGRARESTAKKVECGTRYQKRPQMDGSGGKSGQNRANLAPLRQRAAPPTLPTGAHASPLRHSRASAKLRWPSARRRPSFSIYTQFQKCVIMPYLGVFYS